MQDKFAEAYLKGDVSIEAIDDYIDMWHTEVLPQQPPGYIGLTIFTYLGLTWKEYAEWVEHGNEKLEELLLMRKS